MDWTSFGIPGAVVLVAGALFAWYHRITQATIKNLETEKGRLKDQLTSDQQPEAPPDAQVRAEASESQQVVVGEGKTGDISLSSVKSPTIPEIEDKEERDKVRRIVGYFDRRAMHDFMHEEDIALMCQSLNELRIQIQRAGVSTLRDPATRETFRVIHDEISQVLILSVVMAEGARRQPGGEIFDLRMMGMMDRAFEDLEPYFRGEESEHARRRLEGVARFARQRLERGAGMAYGAEPEVLTQAMSFMYSFGAIDQVKTSIQHHIENILARVR